MTPAEYSALTDDQRLAIINSLAQNISSTPIEMEFDTIRVILRGIASGLDNGDLKAAAKAVTDVIYFKSEMPQETPDVETQIDGIFPLTGLTFLTDAYITHADGTRE